jgi:glycosyltransferase involved in cell wall biosynthesis
MGAKHQFFVIINQQSPLQDESWPEHICLLPIKARWISLREQWELPRVLKKQRIDLLHAPSFVAPIANPCRLVMTIHDLNHLVLPQFYTPFHQIYYRFFVRSCIKRSEYILTVSQFSKQEIVRNLGLKEDKVFVTYNGVSERYKPITDMEQLAYVRDIYGLPADFILCLANNKPHKNLLQLVRAYCLTNISTPLVLASPFDKRVIEIAESFNKKHLIYFSKFIREDHLPHVYSLARMFVYPSTYEGFGLPPLEALACGSPVLVSKSTSLPEVVGNNAIFFDPFDYEAIAKALLSAMALGDLRKNIGNRGVDHARRFSWHTMTEETLKIYELCCTENAPKLLHEAQA